MGGGAGLAGSEARLSGLTFPGREKGRFRRKNGRKINKSEGKSKEFGHGNAKGGRSTSIETDLWIKTYQNALKSQVGPKAN